MMKRVVAGCIVACSLSTFSNAANFTRTANSGVATIVHLYDDWDPTTCRSAGGVVKLVNKPQHGKLTTGYVYRIIHMSGYTGRVSVCAGTPIKSFRITYRSQPRFRGLDSFTVDVTLGWGNRHSTDVYTINVQ